MRYNVSVSVGGPLDGPLELARLVPPGELEELIDAVRRALGAELAIFDPKGRRLAGPDSAAPPTREVQHDVELLARRAATGDRATDAFDLAADTLGLLVHHANARELAA